MKRLSWFNKIMFYLNIVVTVLTFIAYVLPFLAPKTFPVLSVLTLVLPFFLILNGLFFLYWLLQLRKRMFISGMVLLIGITFINKFYKFSAKDFTESENDFVVMSYNVRLFNLFDWITDKDVKQEIKTFFNDKDPDILCIQEYSETANIDLRVYPHRYIFMQGDKIRTGLAIFSRFPILNQGNLVFPKSNNNAIFVDIKKGNDIIRIYNLQLQSIKISPDVNEISENINEMNKQKSQKLVNRISIAFRQQQQQAEIIRDHKKECSYPIIICGDINNSAFSYVYRSVKGNLNDAFEESGVGFGKTYNFKYYPVRIDYILTDPNIKVKSFENFSKFDNSDHYPVMARLSME
jgi:endonuclease/exonuclease/phosphatase family metal-dependent hydrolase